DPGAQNVGYGGRSRNHSRPNTKKLMKTKKLLATTLTIALTACLGCALLKDQPGEPPGSAHERRCRLAEEAIASYDVITQYRQPSFTETLIAEGFKTFIALHCSDASAEVTLKAGPIVEEDSLGVQPEVKRKAGLIVEENSLGFLPEGPESSGV